MSTAARAERDDERLRGLGVSPGIAIGSAMVLEGRSIPVERVALEPRDTTGEVMRFDRALREAERQLKRLHARILRQAGENYARVFQAQILILNDPAFSEEIAAVIREERVNAEWALRSVLDRYRQIFSQLAGPDHQERGTDLEDVETRVLVLLSGNAPRTKPHKFSEDSIVISRTLSPSDIAALNRARVIGLAIDAGGPTSHTAIIAAALGIPAIVGLRNATSRLRTGDRVILDGADGLIVRNPTPNTLAEWRAREQRMARRELDRLAVREQPATTRDGIRVTVRANIEFPAEVEAVKRFGGEGIGLYRSEFLYLTEAPLLPDEQRHYNLYRELAEKSMPHEVVIRTLDLAGERYSSKVLDQREPNPVLGLRGMRLSLDRTDLFRTQLRGILRAAVHGKVRVMFPMVSGLEELRQARSILDSVREELQREGVSIEPEVPVGVMIEVPSAALIADRLAGEVDFISIGTNDLIQYALAIDRGNPSVSYLYQPLHPAILELLRKIIGAGVARGLRVSVCGAMAADPVTAVALLGLGVSELSMSPVAIPVIKQVIRCVSAREAGSIMEEALHLGTAAEITEFVRRRVLSLLPDEYACPR